MTPHKRMFDLLTAPMTKGTEVPSIVRLSFAKPRNFTMEIAPAITSLFKVSGIELGEISATSSELRVVFECLSEVPVRFAALVECETDEPDAQGSSDELGELADNIRESWNALAPGKRA